MLQTIQVRGHYPEYEDCLQHNFWIHPCFNYCIIYPTKIASLSSKIHFFLSIIIICAISSISSITSIQLFSEEGIIHRLGEGFYQHKILPMQAILYSI